MTDAPALAIEINDAQLVGTSTRGERRLWLAVLELALVDAAQPTTLGAFSRAYLDSERRDYLGAFRSLCDEFDLRASTLRAYAAARYGQVPQRGEYRGIYLARKQPHVRRLLSATVTRRCVSCGGRFSTPWKQQKACSRPCQRRYTRQQRQRAQGGASCNDVS